MSTAVRSKGPVVVHTLEELARAKELALSEAQQRVGESPVDSGRGSGAGGQSAAKLVSEANPVSTVNPVSEAGAAGHEGTHRVALALVPTMGALHAGHQALLRQARADADIVVLTIFINPLQFGDLEDLRRYPQTLESDVELASEVGVDIIFAPTVEQMYPEGEPSVRVHAGELGTLWEGAFRKGHFDGMLTVVAKLLHLGAPGAGHGYRAYFGQKDFQQLVLVRQMVQDLNFPVEIIAVPIVRETDGLALSSRNRFLTALEREQALSLNNALKQVTQRVDSLPWQRAYEAALAQLRTVEGIELEYFAVVDPDSLEPVDAHQSSEEKREYVAIVAARVGQVRLIDNMALKTVKPFPPYHCDQAL